MGNVSHHRLLSHSEISAAQTCHARWDFAYGGHLAGSALEPKDRPPVLSEGRAWGAAVAAWHQGGGDLSALWDAHRALRASLDKDAAEMAGTGFAPSVERRVEAEERLSAILDHYAATAEPFQNLSRIEQEIIVPIPSRSGTGRASTLYRFQCFLDGFTDEDGDDWLVEFKLRGRLTDPALIERQSQPRWYAWAWWQKTGRIPAGIYIDERLNEAPKEPKLVKGRKKGQGRVPSHDKQQLTTAEAYANLCLEHGELPRLEVTEALRARQWQYRHPLMLRPDELDRAGRELVSAAKIIRDLDRGELAPTRNALPAICGTCKFRDICAEPTDRLYLETLFTRAAPKRLRVAKEQGQQTEDHPLKEAA